MRIYLIVLLVRSFTAIMARKVYDVKALDLIYGEDPQFLRKCRIPFECFS